MCDKFVEFFLTWQKWKAGGAVFSDFHAAEQIAVQQAQIGLTGNAAEKSENILHQRERVSVVTDKAVFHDFLHFLYHITQNHPDHIVFIREILIKASPWNFRFLNDLVDGNLFIWNTKKLLADGVCQLFSFGFRKMIKSTGRHKNLLL